jgi:1,4-alpha-glucan branching enzyme
LLDVENYVKTNSFLNKGVLFTYNGLKSSEVELCGNFYAWKCVPMQRNRYGIYYVVISANFKGRNEEIKTSYEYKFKVDDIFDYDSVNSEKIEDGEGSYYSVFNLFEVDFEKNVTVRVIESETDEDIDFKTVEFRIYKPEANTVALIGDFNQWNPEHDYLLKERNGIFTLRKKLKPDDYLYYYIIDGEQVLDTYNPETRFRAETEELYSYLKVDKKKDYEQLASDGK